MSTQGSAREDNGGGGGRHNKRRRRLNGGGGKHDNNNDIKDLSEKLQGNEDGYGYPSSESDNDYDTNTNTNIIGKKKKIKSSQARKEQRLGMRSFRTDYTNNNNQQQNDDNATALLPTQWTQLSSKKNSSTTSNMMGTKTPHRPATNLSKSSGFTLSSAPRGVNNNNNRQKNNSNNPYTKTPATNRSINTSSLSIPSTSRTSRSSKRTTHHVVCAVSENLARETCVTSLDAGRPTYLHITKQGNGQTYAETMSLLRMLNPDEVLLNEGRKNSQLATKIMGLFNVSASDGIDTLVNNGGGGKKNNPFGKKKNDSRGRRGGRFSNKQNDDDLTVNNSSGACETTTVVKFVPRSYFDQTKGAEMLRKLSREDTYDASLVEEYILLSSSYAVLQYAQLCLGACLTRGSLALDVNVGGNDRMNIDRSTMVNLELLVNAKTGRTLNSLVGTIDCTKTSVGGRLLRTNIMAPPTRLDTINARLDLVDSLLEDEEFFYVVMEHLEDLPDVDKMLSHIALTPRKRFDSTGNGALFGNTERQTVTARIASKGISALVCIKSTLSVVPSFAHVLEVQLKELYEREDLSSGGAGASNKSAPQQGRNQNESSRQNRERSNNSRQDDDESTTIVESETSRNEEEDNTSSQDSSLHIGLGGKRNNNNNATSMPSSKQTRHQLLRAILIAMKQPALSRVLAAVTDIFTESTSYSKNSHAMRHQECFALKPNTDGMMDVLRKAFLANVDDIYRLADEYAETYDINVQVKETTSRGYYLSVSADLGLDLPQIFIQPVKNGRFIHCTTEEVYSLNSRAQENVQDLLLMTHGRIQETLQVARDNYDCIASLSDAVALLDMCHCFADNVASSRLSWCRPVLSDRDRDPTQDDTAFNGGGGAGAIAIRNGRYAIDVSSNGVSSSLDGGDFVPNDTYSSALQNFTVITGINGSGKSTYLKQIALIVILAHCGSYVPADEALLPVRDKICTRIGTADDQEHNISTFLLEMKETAFICNSTTDKSLFLLDELGRATSNEDGVAVAWAVSEYLLTKRAMTFFVTHYPQIAKLSEVYPNVQNQHLGAHITSSSSNNGDRSRINYTHKIMPGPCKAAGDYGVEMAVTCGWPDDAVNNARRIREEVKRKMPGEDVCYSEHSQQNENFAENRRNAHNILCDIAKHLAAMKEGEGRLSKEAKKNYLQELRDRLVPTNGDSQLVRTIRNLLLNTNDEAPSIPLTNHRPLINASGATANESGGENEAGKEDEGDEAMPDQTKEVAEDSKTLDKNEINKSVAPESNPPGPHMSKPQKKKGETTNQRQQQQEPRSDNLAGKMDTENIPQVKNDEGMYRKKDVEENGSLKEPPEKKIRKAHEGSSSSDDDSSDSSDDSSDDDDSSTSSSDSDSSSDSSSS